MVQRCMNPESMMPCEVAADGEVGGGIRGWPSYTEAPKHPEYLFEVIWHHNSGHL